MNTRRSFFQSCGAFVAGCALSVGMAARQPTLTKKTEPVKVHVENINHTGFVEGIEFTHGNVIVNCGDTRHYYQRTYEQT